MDIKPFVHRRYTTKKYDPAKKIPDETMQQIIDLLRFTPTSINSQPYHFIIASTEEGKGRIAKSMDAGAFIYNRSKVTDASHIVIICAKTDMDETYIRKIIEQEIKDGRSNPSMNKEEVIQLYSGYMNMHKIDMNDLSSWMGKQCYIALGNLLLGASVLGIDASPLEGFDSQILDREFNLAEQGFTSLLVVPMGYHAETDYNLNLPKSRFPQEELFTLC